MASDFDNIFGGKSDFDSIFAGGTAIVEPEPVRQAVEEAIDRPRPGLFERGLKKFGAAFAETLASIRTESEFGKGALESTVLNRRVEAAQEAGLLPPPPTFKDIFTGRSVLGDFLAIPEEQTQELFAGETFEDEVARLKKQRITETLAPTQVPAAETIPEKAVDVAGGVAGFVTKLAIAKKAVGGVSAPLQNITAWETLNLADGGTPGKGAAMFLALRGIDKLPIKGTKGFLTKTSTQSALFAGTAAAAGGGQEEIITAALLPWALRAVDAAVKGGAKIGRAKLEKKAVDNLRNIGKENGLDLSKVPDDALKFIVGKSRQARFWNKQFSKGKITEETLNKRLDQLRQDLDPTLRAVARTQPSKAEPGDIVPVEPTVTTKPTPPTTVAEIFKPKAPVKAVTPTTEITPPAVTPQVSEGLEAKPEAVEPKPTTISEIFAEPTVIDKITGPKQPEITDQTLLSERSDIKSIPQKERTPQQITRINEIEDELVLRHADEFEDIDISPKTRKIETKKVQDEITSNGIYQAELDAIGDIPNLSGSFNVDSQEIGDVKARFEGRKDILKKFTLQEEGGLRWDQAAEEIGIEKLDEFMDMVELFVDSNKAGKGAISDAALARALNSGDPSIEIFALKHDMLKNGFTAAEINKEITELAARENINLADVEQDLISLQEITDVDKKQAILRELDKTTRKAKVKKITEPEQVAISKARKVAFQTKKPAFVREKDGKFTVTKVEPRQGDFIKVTPPVGGKLEGTTERITAEPKKPKPTPEQTKEVKLLIQRINIAKKIKGLTEKDFSDIKIKAGGSRRLTGRKPRTVEQLKAILKAIEKARPKIVAHKKVITRKTEKQISELRKNLTDLEFMNDTEFQKILDIEVRGKEAKFISARSFITQSEANKILARMHDTAQRLRVTEPIRKAVEKNPEVAAEIKKTDKLPSKAKDPSRLRSMRFFFQRMGEQASQPIYEVFLDLTLEEQLRSRFRHNAMKRAESLPDFAKIANDKEALQRVEDWITSQSRLAGKPKSPKDITKNEKRLARLIQASFESYETLARAGKMFEFFDNRAEMPQYLKFKQGIDKAFDIFNTKGYNALITYLDTQDWGIVSAGYSPMESVIKKVSTNRMPDIAVGKGRVRQRGIAYRKQDRDILQRWYSYMRQMDQLIHIQPRVKSLVRLVNDNQDSFIRPGKINSAVSTYLDNLKHTNYEDGLIEEWSRRLYSQAITVRVLADPLKPFRNLAQNLAFSEDRRDFLKISGKKAIGKTILSAEDTEYLETHVQQSSVMMSDWAFVGEDPLLFKNLTKWIQRKTLYPASDRINRLMSFSAKIDRVRTAFNKKQSLAEKMTQARFSDMQKTEQRAALEILAKDGIDPMARFVAKVHTDNTHFLYAREQRSPAEQTKLGRIALNLALFRRAALEKAIFQLEKVFQRGTGFNKKRRAASVLVSLLGFSALTGVLWKRLTGQKYSPYSYFSFLELNFGGLEVATIEKAEAAYNDMLDIIGGDDRGKAIDRFGTDITRVADYMIPFYDIGLRAIEATLGTENIDRVPFKKMREIIDSEFESRGLKEINRSLVQKIQFTFAASRQTKKDKDDFTFTGTKE